jgi:hypothetical protein
MDAKLKRRIENRLRIAQGAGPTGLAFARLLEVVEAELDAFVQSPGPQGDPGYTPQKGTDYFTQQDKEEIATLIAQRIKLPKDGLSPVPGRDYPTQTQIEAIIRAHVSKIQIPIPQDGRTPVKGRDYLTNVEIDNLIAYISDKIKAAEETPEGIKAKLQSLKGDARLDAAAIKNIPDFSGRALPTLSVAGASPAGASKMEISINGAYLGRDIRKLNFTGVTGSRAGDGVATIDVSASAGGNFAENETPSGVVDGSNVTYTLAHTPIGSVQVVWNGQVQVEGINFNISGTTITFTFAPDTGVIRVWYRY